MTAVAVFTGAITNSVAFICIALLFVVNAGYGGGFSNLPTLLSDIYGMGSISSLHGIALSAWAFAGLTGNQIAEVIINASPSHQVGYQNVLYFTIALYAIATLVDFLLVKSKKEKAPSIEG